MLIKPKFSPHKMNVTVSIPADKSAGLEFRHAALPLRRHFRCANLSEEEKRQIPRDRLIHLRVNDAVKCYDVVKLYHAAYTNTLDVFGDELWLDPESGERFSYTQILLIKKYYRDAIK